VSNVWTRMGDGQAVVMTSDELRKDIIEASEDAADKGKVPILEDNEIDKMMEIFTAPWRVIGVEPGHEVPLTKDETACTLISSQLSSGSHLPISREAAVEIFERVFAFDTMELGWIDYSFKQAKPMVSLDQVSIERLLATTVFPILYGAMPNMGLYYTPDGPFTNPADLLGMMKVEEAREMQMKASELCEEDMIFVCKRMAEIGADGIDFDTTASAGDADFLAVLKTVEELKKTTNLGIEVGMSGEFILGMHGEVEYKGTKLAGLWPHQQLKVVEQAGADMFGPVVNTKTNKSAAWNVARAVTMVKEVCKQATIPIHANVGMGVGGTPMFETPPVDALSRASVAMVEIAKVDGL
jgi:dimethylamine---corrinoid protein Co-methyltransferase